MGSWWWPFPWPSCVGVDVSCTVSSDARWTSLVLHLAPPQMVAGVGGGEDLLYACANPGPES